MEKEISCFKIRDSSTGLFSLGGYGPGWDTEGKTWKTIGNLRRHLLLFKRGYMSNVSKEIPTTWEVVEIIYTLKINPICMAKDFIK